MGNKTNLKSASPDTLLTQSVIIEPGWRTNDLERRSLIRSFFYRDAWKRTALQAKRSREEGAQRAAPRLGPVLHRTPHGSGDAAPFKLSCELGGPADVMYGYSGLGKSLNDHRLLSVASTSHVAPNAATSAPSQNSEQSQGDNK